jgi:anaerobic ribonucleoside-triphosphate reductase activating protein
VKLQLARMAYPVTSLGPGRRVALWVSGCGMRCRGCITPDLWDMAAGRAVEVDRVLQRILALDLPLDGITLSGGEPFDQPAPLGWLLRRVRAVRPDWSSLVFSGYPYPALKAGAPTPMRCCRRSISSWQARTIAADPGSIRSQPRQTRRCII